MDIKEVIDFLKVEHHCVRRANSGCDRDWGKCDLCLPVENVLHGYETAMKYLEELDQYRQIGTLEECSEARERALPKLPSKYPEQWVKRLSVRIAEVLCIALMFLQYIVSGADRH